MIKKTAMIALIGRPNVGKSTLVNALVGQKISIVTPKPQTTRYRIFGVAERDETQLVFIDTPGFHRARNKLGEYMVKVVEDSVADVDAVCLLVEPKANIGRQEELLIEKIKKLNIPAVLVINKIDTIEKAEALPVIAAYAAKHDFEAIIPLSAKREDGLDILFDELEKFAVESDALFPEDAFTDQTERTLAAELIREKMLLNLDSEVPHGVNIEITKFLEREDGVVEIEATIYCEKQSHKGIIIGKNGEMLKKIGHDARAEIEKMLEAKVFLETWVKVKENWRDSGANLRSFGFREE
ncbi:MAG: GTPase Era [Oscillospiraceae bacterium]|nr:GTPase Era [Oscillospiraceae bacterium]